MNFDLLQKSIPKECLRAYLEKGIRYDNRKFTDSRKFHFSNNNILKGFDYSAIGSLGQNKILLVLKEIGLNNEKNNPIKEIKIENFAKDKSSKNIDAFINGLINKNIVYSNENNEKSYILYITIQSIDGNIFEVIAKSLSKFFSKDFNTGLIFNKSFISKTFCFIEGKILLDPLIQEVEEADFVTNIVKFEDNKYFIFKISGGSIEANLLQKALETDFSE